MRIPQINTFLRVDNPVSVHCFMCMKHCFIILYILFHALVVGMVNVNVLGLSAMAGLVAVFFLSQWVMGGSPTGQVTGTIPTPDAPPSIGPVQDVYLKATQTGLYDPGVLTVKQNVPVNLHFSADAGA